MDQMDQMEAVKGKEERSIARQIGILHKQTKGLVDITKEVCDRIQPIMRQEPQPETKKSGIDAPECQIQGEIAEAGGKIESVIELLVNVRSRLCL